MLTAAQKTRAFLWDKTYNLSVASLAPIPIYNVLVILFLVKFSGYIMSSKLGRN